MIFKLEYCALHDNAEFPVLLGPLDDNESHRKPNAIFNDILSLLEQIFFYKINLW